MSAVESLQVSLRRDSKNKSQSVSKSIDRKDDEGLASRVSYSLEGRATREGGDLIAIGYKYNSRKSLCFICQKNAGSTEYTDFYEAKWKDSNGTTESRRVPRPDVMGRYF